MNKLKRFLKKILLSNFNNSLYKYIYLYNELFISIYGKDFVLFGISLKSSKIIINKYSGENTRIGKTLIALIRKYEIIFVKLIGNLNIVSSKIGDESDFINIYDKKLNFEDIKKKLNFTFIDDYGYRRTGHTNFNFKSENSILDIYHSDYECSKCHGPTYNFNNFPNYHKTFDNKYFSSNLSKKSDFLFTNITDYESITIGGNEKINDILSNKELIKKYDLISLNKTCISVIMGDDIKSIFKYNKINPKKIFYTDQNTNSPYRTVINYLKNITIKESKIKKPKNNIIFFGLNKNRNTYEIINFLKKEFSINVEKVLIPNIRIGDIKTITQYNSAIFFTGRETKAQDIFKLYPLKGYISPVPFGFTINKNLFKEIIYNIGNKKDINKLDNIFNQYKKENIQLYEKAKKYGIGFIIYDFHINQFLNDNFRGTTIFSMLEDMGFILYFFIYKTNNKYLSDIEKLSKKKNINNIVSNKEIDLKKFIEKKDIQLYYSEISGDKRILKHNKEIFSVGDLEYGIKGFYKTFNTLIGKCNKVKYITSILNIINK